MEQFSFEKLQVYVATRKLVVNVYALISRIPQYENFALASQIRRSIISVPSNIAEGCGRISYKEKIHFLEISYGSLLECFCQLEICRDLGYISEESVKQIKPEFYSVSRMINALSKSYQKHLNS